MKINAKILMKLKITKLKTNQEVLKKNTAISSFTV